MSRQLVTLALLLSAAGCCGREPLGPPDFGKRPGTPQFNGAVRPGTPITHVQLEYGLPDVISDTSGDLARSYAPSSRPAEEWPAEAPRTFYYLDRDLAVTFVLGRATAAGPIEPGLRDRWLQRQADNQSRRVGFSPR